MFCGNCGQNNAPGALLCAQCGASLTSADPGGTPAAGQQPPPPGEGFPPPGAPGAYPPAPQGPEAYPPGPPGPESYPPEAGYPSDPGGYAPEYPPGPPGYPPAPPGYPPGPGYVGPPGPGGPGGGKKSQKGLLIGILAFLVVAAVGAASFLVLSGGDDSSDKVLLEPIGQRQPDDFAGNLDVGELGSEVAIALTETPARETAVEAQLAGTVAPGTEPGLYGGSQNAEVCDVEQLVQFLTDEANSAKAEAWAGVLGIEVGDVATYIEGLTPVRLRFDTRVTNHGFSGGEANAFQSVLQAGTAVMVDSTGVPRVKCNCGNPLSSPQPLSDSGTSAGDANDVDSLASNPDDAWGGFEGANVVVVNEGDTVETFVMMDFEEGALFRRPVGSDGSDDQEFNERGDLCEADGKLADSPTCTEPELGTGDVQVTLRWDSRADLDLHVLEPDGTEIYWDAKGPTSTGGLLDVDANALCGDDAPIENVYWPEGQAPTGTYTVNVVGYALTDSAGSACGSGDFTLTIRVAGQDAQVITGTVGEDETLPYTFEG